MSQPWHLTNSELEDLFFATMTDTQTDAKELEVLLKELIKRGLVAQA